MSVNASRPFDDLVAVMDRLRSPGGCPWDAAQTHASLARHALEEAYELVETLETDDRAGMREELGDLLLQVVFNARVAHEHEREPFGIDDVVRDLTAKLVRRHPHVFADETYVDDASLTARWDAIKQEEKARTSCLDGVPLAQGALSRAQKVLSRAGRAGLAPTAALSSAWWSATVLRTSEQRSSSSCATLRRSASTPKGRCARRRVRWKRRSERQKKDNAQRVHTERVRRG